MTLPSEQYQSGQYLENNPSWDSEDSAWKAAQVFDILERNRIHPTSLVEIGCGAGGVLASLRANYPKAGLFGYDIAPDAARFWQSHKDNNISFHVGDFFTQDNKNYSVALLLDVIEHVVDPFTFLCGLHGRAEHFALIIPLDLSAFSVLRETPLLYARKKTGHIHYFTKNLALSLLDECGFEIIECRYTGSAFSTPNMSWRTKLAMLPRYLANMVNHDMGVRLLGGDTLIVLAKSKRTEKSESMRINTSVLDKS